MSDTTDWSAGALDVFVVSLEFGFAADTLLVVRFVLLLGNSGRLFRGHHGRFSQLYDVGAHRAKTLPFIGSEIPVRVSDIDVIRICSAFVATPASATVSSPSVAATTALATTTAALTGPATAATLIIGSHCADISAFVARVAVGIIQLGCGMNARN
ncbi:hypothetical protein MHU86_25279 [Fragilaria crotonensis]|nr:hypothetical protein MHU86_25279 [Fragilaria crotonensis]